MILTTKSKNLPYDQRFTHMGISVRIVYSLGMHPEKSILTILATAFVQNMEIGTVLLGSKVDTEHVRDYVIDLYEKTIS